MDKKQRSRVAPLPKIGGPFEMSSELRDALHASLDQVLQTSEPAEIALVRELLLKLTNRSPDNPRPLRIRPKKFRGNYP
jgi:hypothetical protein